MKREEGQKRQADKKTEPKRAETGTWLIHKLLKINLQLF